MIRSKERAIYLTANQSPDTGGSEPKRSPRPKGSAGKQLIPLCFPPQSFFWEVEVKCKFLKCQEVNAKAEKYSTSKADRLFKCF